jgi:hypothetical protein
VAPGAGSPSGIVHLFDGAVEIGAATLVAGEGASSAVVTTSFAAPGTHALTAAYDGDPTFNGSTSATSSHTVNDASASTTTTLALSSQVVPVGAPVTLEATLETAAGKGVPTGEIEFLDGDTSLGVVPLSASGSRFVALLTTATIPAGARTLVARYAGDTVFAASASAPQLLTVYESAAPTETKTDIASSPNPSMPDEEVTLTATVKAKSQGVVDGVVDFYVDGVRVGTAALEPVRNTMAAQLRVSTLALGNHAVSAVYRGSTAVAGSTSPELTQTVSTTAKKAK